MKKTILAKRMAVVVASRYDNCCKSTLLDWTLLEADSKWKIQEFYHKVSQFKVRMCFQCTFDLLSILRFLLDCFSKASPRQE